MDANGNLYGTTAYGGNPSACSGGYGCGTIFRVTASGEETVFYSFGTNPNDGFVPMAELVMDATGNLYGTTAEGGNLSPCPWDLGGCGTVFKVTPSGTETVLYTFCQQGGTSCTDGASPDGLVFGTDGNLYGTTAGGGKNYGTVFKVTPSGQETVLYSFTGGGDGAYPLGGVIFDANGNLYGTTAGGGINGKGTAFKITPSGQETVLYYFCVKGSSCMDGANPSAGLIFDKNGNFYGTTASGGAYTYPGTVFELTSSGQETVLYSFSAQKDEGYPWAGLVLDTKGNLYGTTGSPDTVFELTQQVGSVTLSLTSLSFGNQAQGTTSSPQSVQLTNTGPDTLVISSITVSGEFAISANTCPAQLIIGQSCQVSVTFTPIQLGSRAGTLIFVDNAPGSPQTVVLSGTSVLQVTLTPTSFNFGRQKVGTTSKPQTFTLTNNLSVTLTNIAIATTGDFAVSATTCGTSLAANQSCAISVTFTPTNGGFRQGQLSVSDSANNSPQNANLSGWGIGACNPNVSSCIQG